MKLKKLIVASLAAAMLLGSTLAGAYKAEGAYKTVTIPMDGSVKGRIVTANGSVSQDEPAAAILDAVKATENVTAAINGMFFASYYKPAQPITFPANCPLILTNLAQNGQAIVGNGKSNTVGLTADGKVVIDVVDMKPGAYVNGRGPVLIWTVNGGHNDPNAVVLITEHMNLPFTPAPGSSAFLIQDGVVTQQVTGPYTVQAGQSLLVFNSSAATSHAGWSLLPSVGSKVEIKTTFESSRGEDWSAMTSVAGGGRMLVHNGRNVAADASYNAALDAQPKQDAASVLQRSFIAVLNNGTALLGTGVGSFNNIAQFLLAKGATDAVSLDGGASSMLYENGSFVTSAGRELASVLVFTQPKPEPVPLAIAQPAKATLDGKPVTLDAYNIGGNNYVKLRDFAFAMSQYTDSDKAFNVVWNNDLRAIELTSDHKYTVAGGEMELSPSQGTVTPIVSQSPIYKDGTQVSLKAYNIANTNYFKLRDLCQTFDIGVDWDNATRTVVVDTSTGYAG